MDADLAREKTAPDLEPIPPATEPEPEPLPVAPRRKKLALQRAAEAAILLVGFLLVAVITVAVTVLRPEVPDESPEAAEARHHLQQLFAAQQRYFLANQVYVRDLAVLGVAAESERFLYRVFEVNGGESFVAYAVWKDPARVPRRFMRLDADGRITPTRLPGADSRPAARRAGETPVPPDEGEPAGDGQVP